MPDGKLHIKGTITIKSSKEEKEEKSKGKKGRKDKEFSMKYKKPRKRKGTGTGTAITGQSFGQTTAPYTPQAFMASMALRPQLTYSPEQFKTSQMQQPALEYAKFEQIPQLGYDVPVVTTRREFEEKAIPLIEENIQRGIKQKKKLLEADLRDAEQQAEERISQVSQEAEERVRDAEYAKQEATAKQQFYENELEQAQGNFIKEKADIALRVKKEKVLGEIVLVGEKAKTKEELKKIKSETERVSLENEVEQINDYGVPKLKKIIKDLDSTYDASNKTADELRKHLFQLKGISQYVVPIEEPKGRGRPTQRYSLANEQLITQLKKKAQEDEVNEDWLQFSQARNKQLKQRLEQSLESMPKESSLSRTLPNYVKTPYGIMTEERSKTTLQGIERMEALDLATPTRRNKSEIGYTV